MQQADTTRIAAQHTANKIILFTGIISCLVLAVNC